MLGFLLRLLPFWVREPLLIAIGSAFAFLRRTIVRACTKLAHAVVAIVRGDRGKGTQDGGRPSGHAK